MTTKILKLSGDALRGEVDELPTVGSRDDVITIAKVDHYCEQIARAVSDVEDLQLAIVVGGGNILRGRDLGGMDEVTADQMGMLATVINSLALKDSLKRQGVDPRVMSGLSTPGVAEPYIYERALKHLRRGRVIVFAGGTGNPYVTTDSAAALRARELRADVLLVAKNGTDGVYDKDPNLFADARRFSELSLQKMRELRLEVMDQHAIQTCVEGQVPLFVFNVDDQDSLYQSLVNPHPTFGTTVRFDSDV